MSGKREYPARLGQGSAPDACWPFYICRGCGCTEHRACMTPSGPCYWVERDWCSGCALRIETYGGREANSYFAFARLDPLKSTPVCVHDRTREGAALQLARRHFGLTEGNEGNKGRIVLSALPQKVRRAPLVLRAELVRAPR